MQERRPLPPQAARVFIHLQRHKTITPLEAFGAYGITRLADAILDIRKSGRRVDMDLRKDAVGRPYGHYVYVPAEELVAA